MHVSDIVATVYDIVGVTPPEVVKGFEQMPVTGRSFRSVLPDPAAPATNTVQYFENAGSLAVVADGWKAVLKHTMGQSYDGEKWELYDLNADRSECNDLAASMPGKLAEMVELWWQEAERNGVFPIDDRGVQLFGASESKRREARAGFLFLSPWLFGLAVFTAFPIIASLLLTFFNASLTGAERHFQIGRAHV